MTVRVRATLADGRVVIGPVRGLGGMMGAAGEPEGAAARVRDRLESVRRQVERGRPPPCYEPAPGCVAMYPEHGPHGDGPEVVVPVLGTVFEVEAAP